MKVQDSGSVSIASISLRDVTREEWAWIAGLFEGEGCISKNTSRRDCRPKWQVDIASTDYDLLERVADLLPGLGAIYENRRPAHLPHWKTAYHWRVADRGGVYAFLVAVYPWLATRRRAKARQAMLELPPIDLRRRAA